MTGPSHAIISASLGRAGAPVEATKRSDATSVAMPHLLGSRSRRTTWWAHVGHPMRCSSLSARPLGIEAGLDDQERAFGQGVLHEDARCAVIERRRDQGPASRRRAEGRGDDLRHGGALRGAAFGRDGVPPDALGAPRRAGGIAHMPARGGRGAAIGRLRGEPAFIGVAQREPRRCRAAGHPGSAPAGPDRRGSPWRRCPQDEEPASSAVKCQLSGQ